MYIEFLNLTQTCCITLEVLFYLIWEEEDGGERGELMDVSSNTWSTFISRIKEQAS